MNAVINNQGTDLAERHLIGHRGLLRQVTFHYDALLAAVDELIEHRQRNGHAVNHERAARGPVAAQKIADELGHESSLATYLAQRASATHFGRLIYSAENHYTPFGAPRYSRRTETGT